MTAVVPVTRTSLGKALNAGMRQAMLDDPKVVLIGEDIGALGGVFRVTDGLLAEFGPERVINSPLAESAIVGTAIGLALRGFRPVCEIQFDGFVYPAFDQIVSQLAKMRARTNGTVSVPVTIRIPVGGGIGAVEHHSESNEAYFCHTAGLRVVACANPADAHTMIQQAIACEDPVIFYEPKRRYWDTDEILLGPPDDASLPLDRARVVREGTDVTVIAYGPTVRTALDTATVAAQEGRSLEVIDLRSLSPLDLPTLDRVGGQDRAGGRRARGADLCRAGGRNRGVADRAVLRCTGGTGPAGRRLQHSVPAFAGRRPLPTRDRSHPRRGRPSASPLTAKDTHAATVRDARCGRGPDRG